MASEPYLRRYEVQVAYDTAFLFFGTRAVVAERWGHGPTFSAWLEAQGQITLFPGPDDQTISAVLGIRFSALLWQGPPGRGEADKLARDFLTDCLEAFKPQAIRMIAVRQFWLLPTTRPDAVNTQLLADYPNVDALSPDRYGTVNPGVSFNGQVRGPDETIWTTASVGMVPGERAIQYFGMKLPDEPEWAMGANIEAVAVALEQRPRGIQRDLKGQLQDANRDADTVLGRTLLRYAKHA